MKTSFAPVLFVPFVALAMAAACEKQAVTEKAAPAPASRRPSPETSKAEVNAAIARTLEHYENIRAKLATDDLASVQSESSKLAAASRDASGGASEALRSHLAELSKAAANLEQSDNEDSEALRRDFGEVSRALVAVLSADPSLRSGLHLFECPMAPGYQRWVQASSQISNPYMGTKMLECGSKVDW